MISRERTRIKFTVRCFPAITNTPQRSNPSMPEAERERDDPIEPPVEPVAAAAAVSPENAPLLATIAELTARLEERDRQLNELLGPEYLALRSCYSGGHTAETLRKWCETGVVASRREGKRIFVNTRSLAAHLVRKGLAKAIKSR
jgi:hypothetical protein